MLESREFVAAQELAQREDIAHSGISLALRLTLLEPDIPDANLDGRQGHEVMLMRVMEGMPALWSF